MVAILLENRNAQIGKIEHETVRIRIPVRLGQFGWRVSQCPVFGFHRHESRRAVREAEFTQSEEIPVAFGLPFRGKPDIFGKFAEKAFGNRDGSFGGSQWSAVDHERSVFLVTACFDYKCRHDIFQFI